MWIEPEIHNYFDALWYCFSVISTIGFGDIVVISIVAKILTILLSFYSIIVFAILTATVVNYFSELQKAKYNDSVYWNLCINWNILIRFPKRIKRAFQKSI